MRCRLTEETAKGFAASSHYLWKIYKINETGPEKELPKRNKQIIWTIPEEKMMADETFAGGASSI